MKEYLLKETQSGRGTAWTGKDHGQKLAQVRAISKQGVTGNVESKKLDQRACAVRGADS